MDHQLGMALALVGIIGFLLWLFRPQAPLVVRILGTIVGIGWLSVYCLVELFRSEPTVWSGRAEMSIPTMLLIAFGILVLVSKPKPKDGGERSV